MDMSAQVLRINFVVVALAELVIVPLTREILDFGANTLIGVCLMAAIVACNCWPTAAWNGRALHARMPSCHV